MLCLVIYFLGNLAWIALAGPTKSGLGSGLPEGTDSHLMRAEEALQKGDWYTFSKEYYWLLSFMSQNEAGSALNAALKRQEQFAQRKMPISPILDTYTLDLPWLGQFTDCREDYTSALNGVSEKFKGGGNVTKELLLEALGSKNRKCADVRPDDIKLLRILKELVNDLLDITDKSTFAEAKSNLAKTLQEAAQEYPSIRKSIIYPDIMSDLSLLEGNDLQAIKILWEALKTNKDNPHLMNKLASNVADPLTFIYTEVIKTEIPKLNLDSICDCAWLDRFLKFDSWEEALDATATVVADCECKQAELTGEIKALLRIFFRIGAFKFDIADHMLARMPRQSKVPILLKKIKAFKGGLVSLISGTVDNALRKDLDRSMEYLRGAVKNSLELSCVKKAEEVRKSRERREKAREARLKEEAERKKKREVLEKEVKRLQVTSVQQDQKIDTKFQIYDRKSQTRNKAKGEKALVELDRHLAQGDFYGACPSYYEFDWNGDYVEVRGKQSDIKDALEKLKPPLNRGVLCYCESNDYARAKDTQLKQKRALLEKLEKATPQDKVDENKISKELLDPSLKDVRDECAKFKDVAQLLAEALLWNRSIFVMHAHCKTPTSDDYGDLLGAFSLGLQTSFPVNRIPEVRAMLEFIKDHSSLTFDANSQWGTSLKWMASLLSTRKILTKYANKTRIPVGSLEEARQILPLLGLRLEARNRTDFVELLHNLRSTDWIQMLPLIEEFFRLAFQQLRQQRKAWEDRAYILFKYYSRAGDNYWELVMLEEAFKCRSSPKEHEYMVTERVNVENGILTGIRNWQKTDPQSTKLESVVEKYIQSLGPGTPRRKSGGKVNPPESITIVKRISEKQETISKKHFAEHGEGETKITREKSQTAEGAGTGKKATKSKAQRRMGTARKKVTSSQVKGPRKQLSVGKKKSSIRRASSLGSTLVTHGKGTGKSRRISSSGKERVRRKRQKIRQPRRKGSKALISPESAREPENLYFLLDLFKRLLREPPQGDDEEAQVESEAEDPYVTLLHKGY